MFTKLLIANRGEIACRVIRTARRMGIGTVAVYSDVDAQALHVELADEAVRIGPPPALESYLDGEAIIAAARATGAQAIHPGYGFLSENPGFVEAVTAAGLVFVGPSAASIRAMGLKDAAKDLMLRSGVPVVPGYQGPNQAPGFLADEAVKIGYPVLIKARAGGGGKGMRKVEGPGDFAEALESARREAKSAFGDDHVLVEKFILAPRHIEVQVFGDSHGNVVHLYERDCSLQRRHQKVIEEAPAPGMTDEVRAAMTGAAVRAALAIQYSGAGTIEFIADGSGPLRPDGFWFMEMNTRLQVEHPVTEAITGVDLVEWQLRVAAGEKLPLGQNEIDLNGHAVEARLYAEDPAHGFIPATGKLHHLSFHPAARTETGVRTGDEITPWYDPMIAKIITHGATRAAALASLREVLGSTHVAGAVTNAAFLGKLAAHAGFHGGRFDTGLIERDLDGLIQAAPVTETHIAVAALVAHDLRPDRPYFGWRLWGEAAHDLRFSMHGTVLKRRIVLHGDGTVTLTGGDAPLTLSDIRREELRVVARTGTARTQLEARVILSPKDGALLVSVLTGGVAHDFYLLDSRSGDAVGAAPGNVVLAPMTGVLVKLSVAAGDAVSKGDRLAALEAMKMEQALLAPRDGVVTEVTREVGQTIEGGSVLIRFEDAP